MNCIVVSGMPELYVLSLQSLLRRENKIAFKVYINLYKF